MGQYLLSMPDFGRLDTWFSLLTLTFLEVVLGVDNIIFISIASNKLKEADQPKARRIGLLLALVMRIGLLFGITYLIAMQRPLLSFDSEILSGSITGQSLILMAGGVFLIYKATSEIHEKLEGGDKGDSRKTKAQATLLAVILQIGLIDMVFSFDSILTAVGLAKELVIMIIAVTLSIGVMMLFADPVSDFVHKHPTIQMLALSFLILIGFMLIADGAHKGDMTVAGAEIGSIPKGYLYFAILFSVGVEFLNMRLRRRRA